MIIESLTPDQLVHFTELLLLASFMGAFAGANLGGFFDLLYRLFGWGSSKLFGPEKSELETIADLQFQRRVLLIRARTAGRELRKHRLRQTLGRHAH
ncbi:hypothetical protein [Comamonas avium]|uniref:Uncharacterized protein n=1 Tax=Comamonas avium TaxID=2762231 RepID=A0ABR8S784_9BURK|nr:hypothetical protein [Comamonas avium]MBD7959331.1 hypothetical protein [Comamonas avium]